MCTADSLPIMVLSAWGPGPGAQAHTPTHNDAFWPRRRAPLGLWPGQRHRPREGTAAGGVSRRSGTAVDRTTIMKSTRKTARKIGGHGRNEEKMAPRPTHTRATPLGTMQRAQWGCSSGPSTKSTIWRRAWVLARSSWFCARSRKTADETLLPIPLSLLYK